MRTNGFFLSIGTCSIGICKFSQFYLIILRDDLYEYIKQESVSFFL